MKKGSSKHKNAKAQKVKNEPNLNVNEQQDAVKHLKEYYDIDEIHPHKKKRLCV